MNAETTVPREFQADPAGLQARDVGQLMATVIALGGEVFLLKAELQRLRLALQERGGLTGPELEAAGATADFKAWLDAEHKEFARALLDPFAAQAAAGEPGRPR